MRPYTTVDMMDKLGTFAGQQHQDLSPKYREKSLTWVGIEPTTSRDHRKKHHKLYARVLGKYAVSVNCHMALHIPELIQNWGPPISSWCFPYERHIGLLGDTNTSGKTVEEEIFRNFVVQHLISASRVPTLDSFQEKYIPSQQKPFIDQCLDDHCAETQEEWSVYLRIQAERVFNGVDCIYKLAPSRAQGKLETQLRVEREDFPEETAQQWRVQMLPPQRIK